MVIGKVYKLKKKFWEIDIYDYVGLQTEMKSVKKIEIIEINDNCIQGRCIDGNSLFWYCREWIKLKNK